MSEQSVGVLGLGFIVLAFLGGFLWSLGDKEGAIITAVAALLIAGIAVSLFVKSPKL